jgi:hypothetical protein
MILAGSGGILPSRASRSTNAGSGSFTTHLFVLIRSSCSSIKKSRDQRQGEEKLQDHWGEIKEAPAIFSPVKQQAAR